jgi:hypothetical protein
MGALRVVYETSVVRRGVEPQLEWSIKTSYSDVDSKSSSLYSEITEYSKSYSGKQEQPSESKLTGKLAEPKEIIAPGA